MQRTSACRRVSARARACQYATPWQHAVGRVETRRRVNMATPVLTRPHASTAPPMSARRGVSTRPRAMLALFAICMPRYKTTAIHTSYSHTCTELQLFAHLYRTTAIRTPVQNYSYSHTCVQRLSTHHKAVTSLHPASKSSSSGASSSPSSRRPSYISFPTRRYLSSQPMRSFVPSQ